MLTEDVLRWSSWKCSKATSQLVSLVPCNVQTMVVKTVCNSWATSHRFHEDEIRGCVFGCNLVKPQVENCDPYDSQSHYVVCPNLWRVVGDVVGDFLDPDPVVRLCLGRRAQPMACALGFGIYHYLKSGH